MTPEAFAELAKLAEHIEAGRLPETACPRFAYCGHNVVHGYSSSTHTHRCLVCKHEWRGPDTDTCTACGDKTEVYILDEDRRARWSCVTCKFEWDGEDGTTCPSCGHDFPQYRDKP